MGAVLLLKVVSIGVTTLSNLPTQPPSTRHTYLLTTTIHLLLSLFQFRKLDQPGGTAHGRARGVLAHCRMALAHWAGALAHCAKSTGALGAGRRPGALGQRSWRTGLRATEPACWQWAMALLPLSLLA